MPYVSRKVLDEEVAENHKRFQQYADALIAGRGFIGLSGEDICQDSYLHITNQFGETLILRPNEAGREALSLTKPEAKYPLTGYVFCRIRLVVGDVYKHQVTRRGRREKLAGGKEHFEQVEQQTAIEDESADIDLHDYLRTRLDDRERFVLLQKRVFNRSYEEIADQLQLSVHAVKKIEKSAIDKLHGDFKD